MKKVFAIVLIVCLAMTAVFADKGDFKVGAQVGYGSESLSIKKSDDNYLAINNGGFYVAGTGLYYFSDAVAGRFEVGLNTMGKAVANSKIAGLKVLDNSKADKASPMHFSVYGGLQYDLEVSKQLGLGLGAGWDMLIGKESDDEDAKTNASMGLGFEVVASFVVSKSCDLTLGTKFGWHFVNTDDDIADAYGTADDNGWKTTATALQIFAGLTFAL
ncbi:MAG: outer membrane beta-barrel protein [Spirochaetales bacterium]|nr:outer membrane beta-barrel protein [Spirochaetales bacterium]